MKNRMKLSGLFFAAALVAGCSTIPKPTANPDASKATVKVFNYLHGLPARSDHKLLSGHLAGGAVAPSVPEEVCENYDFKWDEFDYLKKQTDQTPAVLCVDLSPGFFESDNPLETQVWLDDCYAGMKKHWKAGGLVMATTHCMNPAKLYQRGGGVRDVLDLKQIYTPGNELYDNYRVLMGRFADLFQALEKDGVVVIWRPYNEIGHAKKWWCRKPPEEFIALWNYTYDFFTRERGLNNLLWQWDSHVNHGKELDLKYYPGDDVVDIVGVSVYTNETGDGPSDRLNPLPQKVFCIAEIGPKGVISGVDGWQIIQRDYDWNRLLGWIKTNHPYASFFVTWDRTWGPYGRGINLNATYNDPLVINLEQLKNDFPR